jgi:hypothetical protein
MSWRYPDALLPNVRRAKSLDHHLTESDPAQIHYRADNQDRFSTFSSDLSGSHTIFGWSKYQLQYTFSLQDPCRNANAPRLTRGSKTHEKDLK